MHNKQLMCKYFKDSKSFVSKYLKSNYVNSFDKTKDVILLDNNGKIYTFNNIKEAFNHCQMVLS